MINLSHPKNFEGHMTLAWIYKQQTERTHWTFSRGEYDELTITCKDEITRVSCLLWSNKWTENLE